MDKPGIVHTLLLSATICSGVFAGDDTHTLNYLEIKNEKLTSVHAVRIAMTIPEAYSSIEPINYSATFHQKLFNISMAAWHSENNILAFHAEQLADSSGILDYSYMQPTTFNDVAFFYNARCASLTVEDVKAATDLAWYAQNGFDFQPHIYLYQLFKTSADGNAEVVITYGEKVSNCSERHHSDRFKEEVRSRLQKLIKISEPG